VDGEMGKKSWKWGKEESNRTEATEATRFTHKQEFSSSTHQLTNDPTEILLKPTKQLRKNP